MLAHWSGHPGGYGSLEAVRQLFTSPWILTAGWLHYLAFDLFCGAWQAREAQSLRIAHVLVVPCLILTFVFGPMGYLFFLALRAMQRRKMVAHATV